MARQHLEGLKGSVRKFILPVSESVFAGDRIVFRDTGSVGLSYRMNFVDTGKAVIDDDIINLRSGNNNFNMYRQFFSSSEASVSNTYYQEFLPTIPSGYKMKNGTVKAKINGLEQLTNGDQTVTASVDFMIDSTHKKIRIRKAQNGTDKGLGIDLTTGSHWDNPDTTGTPSGANKAGGGTGTGESDIIEVTFQLKGS
jgi:hypothetical protein